MNRNIIDAIGTLIRQQPLYLNDPYSSEDPKHSAHYWSIEEYIRNLFADTFYVNDEDKKRTRQVEVFSYLGNSTNPPDLILRGGDAIEIKNIYIHEIYLHERCSYLSPNAPLILNTVYPRQKLFADDSLVTKSCKEAERWKEKDIIYAVGVSEGKQLTHLCMVYGIDYCASAEHYKNMLSEMRKRLKDIPNMGFYNERYLGKVNAIDPTGATYLDLRNMWHIKNPWSFFNYVYRPNPKAKFNFMCIIREEKFFSFRNSNNLLAWREICPNLIIKQVRIKDPDKPDKMNDAFLIRYDI